MYFKYSVLSNSLWVIMLGEHGDSYIPCSVTCELVPFFFCPPPFRRKVEGHCFWFSVGRGAWCVARGAWRVVRGAWRVVRGSEFLVGTLSP